MPPADDTDRALDALLISVAQNDHAAFASLFDQLGPVVYGISVRVIRDRARAEDISQETFLQVWTRAVNFDAAKGCARTWVATIAHRRAVDAVRHDQNASNRELRAHLDEGLVFDPVAESALAHDHRRNQDVRHCLAALTSLQRESISMAYYDGLTYLEIAERLGVKPATIKTRMRDGLLRLRAALSDESVFAFEGEIDGPAAE